MLRSEWLANCFSNDGGTDENPKAVELSKGPSSVSYGPNCKGFWFELKTMMTTRRHDKKEAADLHWFELLFN